MTQGTVPGATAQGPQRVALVGCGFVADLYMASLATFRHVEVIGAHDRDRARLPPSRRIGPCPGSTRWRRCSRRGRRWC